MVRKQKDRLPFSVERQPVFLFIGRWKSVPLYFLDHIASAFAVIIVRVVIVIGDV